MRREPQAGGRSRLEAEDCFTCVEIRVSCDAQVVSQVRGVRFARTRSLKSGSSQADANVDLRGRGAALNRNKDEELGGVRHRSEHQPTQQEGARSRVKETVHDLPQRHCPRGWRVMAYRRSRSSDENHQHSWSISAEMVA